MINEQRLRNDVEESNRGLILGIVSPFASKVQGNREITLYYSSI
jgi:hypothetical protein